MLQRKNIDYPFEIKSMDEQGVFAGYGTVWGDVDAYSETIAKGAIKKSLKVREPAMLWQHNAQMPVGVWSSVKEDETGLALEGQLALDASIGKDAYGLMKVGAVKGLSVGFVPVKFKVDNETKLLTHTEIELWEVSIVTFPALNSATIESVKSFFGQSMPTEREVEAFLRDAGMSRNLAKTFLSKGYKACLRDASNEEDAQDAILCGINQLLEKMQNVNGDTKRDRSDRA